ncbi:MAG: class A beta-lactamase-related serine hydrolase, partial [Chloroflexia bacterium]|nr:class A beta-lactamase-related serine hydrolase [Chloroflexia bacterium]
MSKNATNLSVVIAIVLMLFTAVMVATRQDGDRATDAPAGYALLGETPPQPASPLDAATVTAFFDTMLPQQLAAYQIPGAAVAVVKDGAILFAQGYGYADLDRQQAVSADQTLFRTGSVAKLFTWTAVMQLVEQGKLDLHTDVNTYLTGFRLPDTYPEPITLAHLLTHTAGFEDASRGAMRAQPDDLEPLGDYLAHAIPARVLPPGQVTAYSNYGAALAGYIVEQVSGQSYAQYMQEQIFDPLGMTHTTVAQPVPATLAAHLATGYAPVNGIPQPQAFEVFQIAPAGSASAPASDMARFMLAHLQAGASGDRRMLQPQTVQLMRQVHFRNAPELSGVGYGWYELSINGRRPVTHAGDT